MSNGVKKLFLFLIILILLSGCFHKKEEVYMDKPAEDGKYHYQNKDLGFAVILPSEFIYYQTQRKETNDYVDIEFFVPTTIEYRHEVPGYGKPMVVRIFEKQAWEDVEDNDKTSIYNMIGEKKGKVYTIKYWEFPPDDWSEKWTDDIENGIVESFKIQ